MTYAVRESIIDRGTVKGQRGAQRKTRKMLYVIGLGLADEKGRFTVLNQLTLADITVKGLEAVKRCERVYLEAYTSQLLISADRLSEFYGKQVVVADRDMVELEADKILDGADTVDVAFLVVGDPYGATTHTDLVHRAHERQIPTKTIHNASIMNAVGACGLQLYRFGYTVSVCFFSESWRPDSFYDRVRENYKLNMHTLCLLDIKVKEELPENMCKKNRIFEPPRFMTVNLAIEQLFEVEFNRKEGFISKNTIAIGIARLGADSQQIIAGTLEELVCQDFGAPLHSLVLAAEMHFLEADVVEQFAVNPVTFRHHAKISLH